MPFSLRIPTRLSKAGWKVKIRDKEVREPPHVSIIRRTWTWRLDLRTTEFMDDDPDPTRVPGTLLDYIDKHWEQICMEWDKMYPENPVQGD